MKDLSSLKTDYRMKGHDHIYGDNSVFIPGSQPEADKSRTPIMASASLRRNEPERISMHSVYTIPIHLFHQLYKGIRIPLMRRNTK